MPAVTSTPAAGGGTQWSLSIQTLLLLTSLTFLPALVLMMTSFTRIIIVFSLLRHALGTQTSPPNQVLVGLACSSPSSSWPRSASASTPRPTCRYPRTSISFQQALERAPCPCAPSC
jgi:flagellar biosynthetic protein FliP